MANYREIPAMVRNLEPFIGNSMLAVRTDDSYIIFSYSTEIARVDLLSGEKEINETKYSSTTSRHQNIVRANL